MRKTIEERVNARIEYFLSVGFNEKVAIEMATFQFPDGVYFRTPSRIDDD